MRANPKKHGVDVPRDTNTAKQQIKLTEDRPTHVVRSKWYMAIPINCSSYMPSKKTCPHSTKHDTVNKIPNEKKLNSLKNTLRRTSLISTEIVDHTSCLIEY